MTANAAVIELIRRLCSVALFNYLTKFLRPEKPWNACTVCGDAAKAPKTLFGMPTLKLKILSLLHEELR